MKIIRARKHKTRRGRTSPRPSLGSQTNLSKEDHCPSCFKVVGERSRYKLVCMLGKSQEGMTVSKLTERMKLSQPTVTHHLQVLQSVNAVVSESQGRERIYRLKRDAHCFTVCNIPY